MSPKTLTRLLIALAALGVIALIVHFIGSGGGISEVSSSTNKAKVFSDFPINDITKIEVKKKDESLEIVKGATSWEVTERENYPANTEEIVKLLRNLWDLDIAQPVVVGRSQYGRLSLLDPASKDAPEEETATVLSFLGKDGKELAQLWLGKIFERSEGRPDPFGGGMAKTDVGRYVKRGDGNSVYLLADTFVNIKTEPADWIDKSFFKVEKLKSIEIITANKGDDWKLERTEENGDLTLVKAGPNEKLDPNKVSSMKSAFASPQIEDVYVGEDKSKEKTGAVTFKIDTFDGFHYEVSVGEKNDLNELPLLVKVSADFPKVRKPGAEESDEEKTKADKEFSDHLASLEKKLADEKRLEGHIFKVRSYVVDSLHKKRSELMEEKKEGDQEKAKEVAPGVSLPGLPDAMPTPAKPAPAPEAKPAEAPKPAVAPEAKPAETVKPAPAPVSKPAEAPKPAAAPEAKPAEAVKPAPAPESKPAEAPKPATAAPEAKPAEAAKPAAAPEAKPAAAPKPAPAPEAKPAEAPKPAPAPESKPAEAPKSAATPEAKP